MQSDSVGEVIATRQLELVGEPATEVLVKIGKPELSEHNDYCCRVQVSGVGEEHVHGIVGMDSVQALQLAMRYVGTHLQRQNTQCGGRLRWGDAPKGWFGFPIDTQLNT